MTYDRAHRSAWQRALAAERRLTRRWTRQLPRPADELLVTLTHTADHSVLWGALAAGAASFGGTRGRRAAGHGMLAIAVASATVNGPMKLLFARRRPDSPRRLWRKPRTSSFPSGHSASAFAFAVAATRELPEAGPVLFPLAAGVAYSRVYLGAYYPSDVIAGGAFGAAVGMAARAKVRNLRRDLRIGSRSSATSSLPSEAFLAQRRRTLDRHRVHVVEKAAANGGHGAATGDRGQG